MAAKKLDINSATAEEFASLARIGRLKANAIVEERKVDS